MSSFNVFVIFATALATHVLLGYEGDGHLHTFCFIVHETIDLGYCTVESHDVELFVIGNVQEQVLAHDSQTDEAEITTASDPRRSADIDAGQTGATVSSEFSSILFCITREL